MNLVEWTDEDGLDHLSWLREQDPPDQVAMLGIPHDPPNLDTLGLDNGQTKELHNSLVAMRLIVWHNAGNFKKKLVQAGANAGLEAEQISDLLRLYAHGPPRPPDLPFDLMQAIDELPLGTHEKECIKQTFAGAGIKNLAGVENAPTTVGHICGLDIYQVIALLTGKL